MNSDSARRFRKLIQFAIGVALLVLAGWLLTTWLPKVRAHEVERRSTASTAVESGDSPEASAPAKSRVRKSEQYDEQIRNRVESMLNIKSNEIAIVTIPKAALDQCLGQAGNPSMADALSVMRGLVTKDALKGCLEGVLKDGGAVKAKVSDQTFTEYSGSEFEMKVEVTETTEGESVVLVRASFNGSELKNQLSIFPGFGLVYQFPPPADEGIVILIGSDPGPATATTTP